MCNCAHEIGVQLGSIETSLNFIKEDSRRRLAELEDRDRDIQDRITEVVAAQTVVNSAIHGRVSRLKYLTLGALGIGATIGAGADWLKEYITKLGN